MVSDPNVSTEFVSDEEAREFRDKWPDGSDRWRLAVTILARSEDAARISNDWRPMPSVYAAREHAKAHPSPLGDEWSAWFCRGRGGLVSMVHLLVLDDGDPPTIASAGVTGNDGEFRPATANGDGAGALV